MQKDLTAYPIVFDINLNYANTMNRMTYLVDGHYIDNQTNSIDVQLITFNGENRRKRDVVADDGKMKCSGRVG